MTHKETGQFYIGYREVNLVPSDQDIGFFYWTSSNKVDKLGFENFDSQIIAEFIDGDSAWYQEQRIIEANIKNPLCLNGHFIKEGGLHFRRTGPHSKETNRKISLTKIGIPRSQECKEKLSISHTGKILAIEHRENISRSLIGKSRPVFSDDWKRKIAKGASKPQIKVLCPYCNKTGGKALMNRWHFDNCRLKSNGSTMNTTTNE